MKNKGAQSGGQSGDTVAGDKNTGVSSVGVGQMNVTVNIGNRVTHPPLPSTPNEWDILKQVLSLLVKYRKQAIATVATLAIVGGGGIYTLKPAPPSGEDKMSKPLVSAPPPPSEAPPLPKETKKPDDTSVPQPASLEKAASPPSEAPPRGEKADTIPVGANGDKDHHTTKNSQGVRDSSVTNSKGVEFRQDNDCPGHNITDQTMAGVVISGSSDVTFRQEVRCLNPATMPDAAQPSHE